MLKLTRINRIGLSARCNPFWVNRKVGFTTGMGGPMEDVYNEFGPKQSWLVMWEREVTPWNLGEPCPGLFDLITAKRVPTSGKFLVPGCGQGYDCFALATPERSVIGIDLADKVISQNHKVWCIN